MMSKHYKNQRNKREKLIEDELHGNGKIIDTFIIDKGHKDGIEKHCITENGVIIIYNAITNKLVTKLVARVGQIKRYYEDTSKEPPLYLLELARKHEEMGYNKQ